jgi:hypothetical protein
VNKPPVIPKLRYERRPIDPKLWQQVKQAAKAQGKRLWLFQEEALREKLERDGYLSRS